MKNRKGFSLIELLGVLIIIGLILLVVLPIVSRLLTSNEKKQYMQYLDVIEKGAIRYADKLKDELGGYNNIACNEIDIVDDLIEEKYIKEYNDKKIECTGKVRLNNDFGNLKTSINLICKNKNTGEETFKVNEINSGDSCIAYDPEARYTVVYNANGATGEMSNTVCSYGSKCSLPNNLYTMNNGHFLGWATSPDGEVIYHDDTTVTNIAPPGETITLYAKWDADTYTIKYFANDETENYTTQNCVVEAECTLKGNSFTRENYAFAGWSTTSSGSKEYDNRQIIEEGLGATGEVVTLYAVWDLRSYIITYSNGGYTDGSVSGEMEEQLCFVDQNCTLFENKFNKWAHTFVGWGTDDGYFYSDYGTYKNISNGKEKVTLNAMWEYDYCTVVFVSNTIYNNYYHAFGSNNYYEETDEFIVKVYEYENLTPTEFRYINEDEIKFENVKCGSTITFDAHPNYNLHSDFSVSFCEWQINNGETRFEVGNNLSDPKNTHYEYQLKDKYTVIKAAWGDDDCWGLNA